MPATDNMLPEGTDTIITGAGVTGSDADMTLGGLGASSAGSEDYPGNSTSTGATSSGDGTTAETAKAKISETATGLKGQATDKVRSYALQGKDRATDALDNIASLVSDAAAQVDERVGPQFGAYARQAADSVQSLASTLRDKDVDELFEDARDAVRKSPAIAIGAAAALGFVLARIAKAGTDASAGTSPSPAYEPPASDAFGTTPTSATYAAPSAAAGPVGGIPDVPPTLPVA